MLSELYFPISVLGGTGKKLKNDQDALVNINLTGYKFFSQPSGTNDVGGGGGGEAAMLRIILYILIVQIFPPKSKMILNLYGLKFKTMLGVIPFVVFFYRHPHGNVDAFLNHINMIVERIHRKKQILRFAG